ncbi:MAG: hypothetical protein Q4B58_03990 [Bacteroidales bacterium]|nr:hypothetical protein [Bacteroidales bacterium]
MQKFIITTSGELIFGDVEYHKDLIPWGENTCFGGGFWKVNHSRGCIELYGRSFDFGAADMDDVRRINWNGIGGKPVPLFYYPNYPDLDDATPVFAK